MLYKQEIKKENNHGQSKNEYDIHIFRENNRINNLALLCDTHPKMDHTGIIDPKALREYKSLVNLNSHLETSVLIIYADKLFVKNKVDNTVNIDLGINVINARAFQFDICLFLIEENDLGTFQSIYERRSFSQTGN